MLRIDFSVQHLAMSGDDVATHRGHDDALSRYDDGLWWLSIFCNG